jgi:pimeloyl-ACP methyl ester carboxylesterase
MDVLPTDVGVIAITLRGHGDSSKPTNGYDIGTFAADVIAVMDALRIDAATLVGHSMGSLVAARIAAQWRHRVAKLVLIGAVTTLAGNTAVEALWSEQVSTLADPVAPEFVLAFQSSCLAVPVDARFFEQVVGESLKMPACVWRHTLRALLADEHPHDLSDIAAPTLVVWGDCDAFADRDEQQRLLDAIVGARLVAHTGIGHAPNWEDPRRTAQDLLAFIDVRQDVSA